MSMNTRQLEDAYLQQVERISQKVHLGEIPHDAGEFLDYARTRENDQVYEKAETT